ncbi:hypothetical protein [uncultured Methanobrevibacter sp.]|uniref:hypothetical protein n=1 Tax=uncultured Methanobrevibacter sp. TaxID=253161 RepID=UPI0026065E63|nr:hypothetical protein [uncultured Methanobrevibacter sp.]
MKLNSKILVALLVCVVAAVAVGVVAAQDASLSDGTTFKVPEGFTLQETDDSGATSLVKDDLAIIILASDAKSPEDGRKSLESKGYTFKSQKDVSGFDGDVVEQAYDKDGMPVYGYICELDTGSYIVVAANTPSDWNVESGDNPVNSIIKSLS